MAREALASVFLILCNSLFITMFCAFTSSSSCFNCMLSSLHCFWRTWHCAVTCVQQADKIGYQRHVCTFASLLSVSQSRRASSLSRSVSALTMTCWCANSNWLSNCIILSLSRDMTCHTQTHTSHRSSVTSSNVPFDCSHSSL